MNTQTGKKGFRKIPDEIKSQILENIKEHGKSVPQMEKEYGVSSKTIYAWLRKDTEYKNPNSGGYSRSAVLEINKLKKEKKELIELIGNLTVITNKIKKKEIIL